MVTFKWKRSWFMDNIDYERTVSIAAWIIRSNTFFITSDVSGGGQYLHWPPHLRCPPPPYLADSLVPFKKTLRTSLCVAPHSPCPATRSGVLPGLREQWRLVMKMAAAARSSSAPTTPRKTPSSGDTAPPSVTSGSGWLLDTPETATAGEEETTCYSFDVSPREPHHPYQRRLEYVLPNCDKFWSLSSSDISCFAFDVLLRYLLRPSSLSFLLFPYDSSSPSWAIPSMSPLKSCLSVYMRFLKITFSFTMTPSIFVLESFPFLTFSFVFSFVCCVRVFRRNLLGNLKLLTAKFLHLRIICLVIASDSGVFIIILLMRHFKADDHARGPMPLIFVSWLPFLFCITPSQRDTINGPQPVLTPAWHFPSTPPTHPFHLASYFSSLQCIKLCSFIL